MKLLTLHKRLSLQAMNPKDKNAEAKANSVGYSINNHFVSLRSIITKKYELNRNGKTIKNHPKKKTSVKSTKNGKSSSKTSNGTKKKNKSNDERIS